MVVREIQKFKTRLPLLVGAIVFILLMFCTSAYGATEGDYTYEEITGGVVITGYSGPGGDLVIPETLGGLPVLEIGDGYAPTESEELTGVFSNKGIINLSLPDGISHIGNYAYANNQLTSLIIPDSVATIGDCAFMNNQILNVTIYGSEIYFGNSIFDSNPNNLVLHGNASTSVEIYATDNGHQFVTIPATVYTITINPTAHGTITADQYEAELDESVILNITPDTGYELDSLKLNGVTQMPTSNIYTFQMPGENIVVDATFKSIINYTGTVTINYHDTDGNIIKTSDVYENVGGTLTNTAPDIADYELSDGQSSEVIFEITESGQAFEHTFVYEVVYMDVFLSFSVQTAGTEPEIEWSECLAGNSVIYGHYASSIQPTSDGGYIVAGSTDSSNESDSPMDAWIAKLDNSGNRVWSKCLGGTRSDFANSIQQTSEGGYIAVGKTFSNDGDVFGNHGGGDAWVVKLDGLGNIVWSKCLGGTGVDKANSIQQTSDGGYIVACTTYSDDGDVSNLTSLGANCSDFWVVKLDQYGNIVWNECLGAYGDETASSIQQTSDGGYIVAGTTHNAGLPYYHGSDDAWVVKLNDLGIIVWSKCLGGSGADLALCIQQTNDGGYILAGRTTSHDGDVSGGYSTYDAWVVRLSDLGIIVWSKCLGGNGFDSANCIQQTNDGEYIVAGTTRSNDGDVSGNNGDLDCWVAKIDVIGIIVWSKCLGGTLADNAYEIQQTSDDGYIVAASTASNDGDVSGNNGNNSIWVVKLNGAQYTVTITEAANGSTSGAGTYDARSIVTLSAASNPGYNFDGWYEGETRVSSLPQYSFIVTRDISLTPIFKAMPKGYLEVTTVGGGMVMLNDQEYLPANYKMQHYQDADITLTATADSGYDFVYWENGLSSSILSDSDIYESLVGTGINIKAVFIRIPTEATTYFNVIFKDKSGKILQSSNVAKNASAIPPKDTPAIAGYDFIGWDVDYTNITNNIITGALYTRSATKYTVTIAGGTLLTGGTSGEYQFDWPVTVVAGTAPTGQKFSHWTMDDVKVSTKTTFAFYVPQKAITLNAVYVDESTVLEDTPFITLSPDAIVDNTNKTITFTAIKNVPASYTAIESGVLMLQSNTTLSEELTVDTEAAILGKINDGSTDQFYIRKTDVTGGDTWYGRAYLIYQDANSNTLTVYSENIISATMAGGA